MLSTLQVIQAFVVPVVVISANGLLLLALYNRLASVISRARTINKERFDLSARLVAEADRELPEAKHLEERIEVLHELGHRLFDRSRLLRDSLVYLLVTVLLMIGCSLSLGLASLWPPFAWLALFFFIIGMLVMALGIAKAIQELAGSLEPLVFEHEMMERWERESEGVNG